MFAVVERIRKGHRLEKAIFLLGYLYLAFWNHFLNKIPSYFIRYYIAKYLYGLRIGRSNLHSGIFLLSPWNISIGDDCNVQMNCFLDGRGGLVIEDNVDLTMCVKVLTEQHDIDSPTYETVKKPVFIKSNAVVGSFSLILPGVTVHEGGVVGAGSVVTRDVPPYSMVAGNPAVKKRDRNRTVSYRLDFKRPFH